MLNAVREEGAVGQAGQGVVEGLVTQLRLEVAPLGHITRV